MKKIFFILVLSIELFCSEHIPFGIKDVCNPLLREYTYTVCYDEDEKVKWVSFNNIKNKEIFNLNENINIDYMNTYSFLDKKLNFVTTKRNEHILNELNNKISTKDKTNIVIGFVFNKNSSIKYEINKKMYFVPNSIFAIITDVDNRKIIETTYLNLDKNIIEESNIDIIRNLTGTLFHIKLQNQPQIN